MRLDLYPKDNDVDKFKSEALKISFINEGIKLNNVGF